MTLASLALGVAFFAGSLRALELWRSQSKVASVNAVVLSALAEGRGEDLPRLLQNAGPGLYLELARQISEPLSKLLTGDMTDVRDRLKRDATRSLVLANRRLQRHAWLDAIALTAIAFAGISALLDAPNATGALGLVAATLLWFSNVLGARSIATRMYQGAMVLVDNLIEGLDQIRAMSTRASEARSMEDRLHRG